jgi:hypothetical protein
MNRVELLPYADVTITVETRTPPIAVVGLVLSALGWLTCGVTAVLGVPISLISLFCRGSKGAGIAGVLVGLPTIAVLVLLLVMAWGVRTAVQVSSTAAQNLTIVMANVARQKLEGEPAAVEVLGVIESIEWDLLRSGEESQKREKSIGAYRIKGSRNSGTILIEVANDDPENTNPDIHWAVLVKDDGSEIPIIDNGTAVERESLP